MTPADETNAEAAKAETLELIQENAAVRADRNLLEALAKRLTDLLSQEEDSLAAMRWFAGKCIVRNSWKSRPR